jgi:hypothetical protein
MKTTKRGRLKRWWRRRKGRKGVKCKEWYHRREKYCKKKRKSWKRIIMKRKRGLQPIALSLKEILRWTFTSRMSKLCVCLGLLNERCYLSSFRTFLHSGMWFCLV